MAPPPIPISSEPLAKRQNTVPTIPGVPHCVTVCMARGNMANCKGPTDFKCLCTDTMYQSSVLSCWQVSCSDSEVKTGMAYSMTGCSMFGVTPNVGPSGASSPIATNISFPPIVYSAAARNIQTVMSIVCSIALALALFVGIINCRNQIRREALTTSRWTAVSGTLSGDSKNRGLRSHTSSGGQTMSHFLRSDGRPAGPLDTITSEDDHNVTFSLPRPAPAAGPSLNRPHRGQAGPVRTLSFSHPVHPSHARFTNRATHGRPIDGEFWELREMRPSPTDVSSGMNEDGKGKGKDKHSDGYSEAAFSSLRSPSTFGPDEPATPTTSNIVSEYGSTTNLRKVAGERD